MVGPQQEVSVKHAVKWLALVLSGTATLAAVGMPASTATAATTTAAGSGATGSGAASSTIQFGAPGDRPVAADYSGDGRKDVAVYRPSTGLWYLRGIRTEQYGQPGDIPVPADYDGDGKAQVAVYRPSTGMWFRRGMTRPVFGRAGDIPVPADYTGDGTVDIAVYRPSTGQWYAHGVDIVRWGLPTDVPQPGHFAGDVRADRVVWRPDTGTWWFRTEHSTAPPVPRCAIADTLTRHRTLADWRRSLLDWTYRLPSTYAPTDLTSTAGAGLGSGHAVRRLLLRDLAAMTAAARQAGAPIAVQSAYRSHADQQSTFAYWVRVNGYERAIRGSARPGHSEHQLGTALDFRSSGGGAPWDHADWATTRAGAWMKANAWRYGFVMSFPKGTEAASCYHYEPWHYRYVGPARAATMRISGLPERAFLWQEQHR